ncbi:MAG: hypothetical protein A2V57_02175 [Candidatus Aminicenantes bacterium RBG_19FT_COMBO_65_30]|nr:MAG: hypothetical protein A2V57_02175 [Candidatus Aminicenantes bacterium RBG_19FT_COMBO_65_30]
MRMDLSIGFSGGFDRGLMISERSLRVHAFLPLGRSDDNIFCRMKEKRPAGVKRLAMNSRWRFL